jgi:hypothetical protein
VFDPRPAAPDNPTAIVPVANVPTCINNPPADIFPSLEVAEACPLKPPCPPCAHKYAPKSVLPPSEPSIPLLADPVAPAPPTPPAPIVIDTGEVICDSGKMR